jgi:RNA polymerase sigma-70 factor (ECF subfamily)
MARTDPLANPGPLIRRVYSYVAYRIGDGPEAEDVTSEVFERAVRYRTSYDAARGGAAAWLIGIARRCIDGRRPIPLGSELVESEHQGPDDFEERTVERLTVVSIVSSLDDRSRELLALRYGAGLSPRQIGSITGQKTNAVEVALHRVRARVRKKLEEQEPTKPDVRAGDPAADTPSI